MVHGLETLFDHRWTSCPRHSHSRRPKSGCGFFGPTGPRPVGFRGRTARFCARGTATPMKSQTRSLPSSIVLLLRMCLALPSSSWQGVEVPSFPGTKRGAFDLSLEAKSSFVSLGVLRSPRRREVSQSTSSRTEQSSSAPALPGAVSSFRRQLPLILNCAKTGPAYRQALPTLLIPLTGGPPSPSCEISELHSLRKALIWKVCTHRFSWGWRWPY